MGAFLFRKRTLGQHNPVSFVVTQAVSDELFFDLRAQVYRVLSLMREIIPFPRWKSGEAVGEGLASIPRIRARIAYGSGSGVSGTGTVLK